MDYQNYTILSASKFFVGVLNLFMYFILLQFITSLDCNDFQVGSEIKSRGCYEALDETAVSGLSCKHGIPLRFLNLKGGERYCSISICFIFYSHRVKC